MLYKKGKLPHKNFIVPTAKNKLNDDLINVQVPYYERVLRAAVLDY